jgi:hypothetical protein
MLNTRTTCIVGLFTGLVVSAHQAGHAEDTDSRNQTWVKERLTDLQEFRFELDQPEPADLAMEPESLLNWSNAERGTNEGGLFLWTHVGRPQMIACAFEFGGSLKYEFHSLSTNPIAAYHDDSVMHRFGPGVEWAALPGAPERARTRALRLVQFRRQAERFAVSVGSRNWAPTRLLPQPVFRCPESENDDLAVFVFVQGTDPECVLLLDATVKEGWRYALTRQTKWGLKAELDGRLAWEPAPNNRPKATKESPFFVIKWEPDVSDKRF